MTDSDVTHPVPSTDPQGAYAAAGVSIEAADLAIELMKGSVARATRPEVIGGLGVEEIRASIGADSLAYISEDDMITATGQPRSRLCLACFDGQYPIPLPEEDLLGKHLLERVLPVVERDTPLPGLLDGLDTRDVEGVPIGLSGGAVGALDHP